MSRVFEEIAALQAADLRLAVFERENRMKGCLSIQANPSYFCNVDATVDRAVP